jgi:hypothetical protein
MSVATAVVSRRMQFCAGPESTVFYACERHRSDLDRPWYANQLFYTLDRWPIEPVNEDDDIACDSCRGEDGP